MQNRQFFCPRGGDLFTRWLGASERLEGDSITLSKATQSKIIFIFAALAIFSSCWLGPAFAREETPQALASRYLGQIEQVTREMESRFPRDQYHYVFLGRSPVPFEAYFEATGRTGFSSLPLSLTETKFPMGEDGVLAREYTERVFPHLDSYLPQNLAGRRVLIIDLHSTGKSIVKAQMLLSQYYGGRDPQAAVEVLSLMSEDSLPRTFLGPGAPTGAQHQLRLPRGLGNALIDLEFKHLARNQRWSPEVDHQRINAMYARADLAEERNQKFQSLVAAIRARLDSCAQGYGRLPRN
jgi:hypothetical protein